MSFLIRRNLPWAWAGYRDLDALHSRPDQNPVQAPWKSVNSSRLVQLVSNQLVIADALSTPFQVGGVSYEFMPYTKNWGVEFDINIDGNVIQQQFFAMAFSSSWAKVGFSDLIEVPMVAIWRDPASTTQNIRVIVYRSLAQIDTLAQTGSIDGLINKNWYRIKMWVDNDRYVRVFINDTLYFAYWLPSQYATGPNKRGLNLLNQTTNPAYIKSYFHYDRPTDFQTGITWHNQVVYDDFARADGAVGNGWLQVGTDAGIVGGRWATTGTNNGSRALLRDTAVTHGAQRVEGVIRSPSSTSDSSLYLRVSSDGTNGLAANFYSGGIYLSRFTGGLASPTMIDYVSTGLAINDGDQLALSVNGECAWVEVNGTIQLMAYLNGYVPGTNQWAGARVGRKSSSNSGSWDDLRILTAF